MVAPNGARRTRRDHPALPESVAETVATAKACHTAGAGALHAHVRDARARHVLDAGRYRELIAEMARTVPDMDVQITTEAVGRYTPAEQRQVVREVMPSAVSVAFREMMADGSEAAARGFYHFADEAGIAVQHILYAPLELDLLGRALAVGTVPGENVQLLFVLGRHALGERSDPAELVPFLDRLADGEWRGVNPDWALCAFGVTETACLEAAFAAGGKGRVGFENSLWHADGRLAADNAERVREIAHARRTALAGASVTPGSSG